MKVYIVFFLSMFCAVSCFSQNDTAKTVILSDTFCFSNHKPLIFKANTKLFIMCDTVFVLNKHTMNLYKAVGNALKQRTGLNTCNLIVENMEKRLEAQNKAFTELHQKYIKLDSTSQQVISETKTSLVQVNNTLIKAQSDIVVVDKKMDDIKKTINKQRAQSFFDKIIYGTGGIAVGLLVGILISN